MKTWRPPIARCAACHRFLFDNDRMQVDDGACYCYECGPPHRPGSPRIRDWLRRFNQWVCLGHTWDFRDKHY